MSILYNRIKDLCDDNEITVTQMCKKAGVNRGSLTDLKNGRSESLNHTNLMLIAEFFGVTTDYLVGKTDTVAVVEVLNASESSVLKMFRELDSDGKELCAEYLRMILLPRHTQKNPSDTDTARDA